MKNILKMALLSCCLLATPMAMAQSCSSQIDNISGLTNTAKQEMIINCEKAKLVTPVQDSSKQASAEAVADNLDKYSDIAMKFAKALGIAAKELGIAVNDFVGTTAGKLTIAFIAYQLFGATLSYVLFGGLSLILVNRLMSRLRTHLTYSGEVEIEVTNIFGHKKTKTVIKRESWSHMYDTACFWFVVSFLLEALIIAIIMFHIPI